MIVSGLKWRICSAPFCTVWTLGSGSTWSMIWMATLLPRRLSTSMTRSTNPSRVMTASVTIVTRSTSGMSARYRIAFGSKYVLAGTLNHCKLLFLRPIRLMLTRLTAETLFETELWPYEPQPRVSDGMNAL